MGIKIEAERNGESIFVEPMNLTTGELAEALHRIDLDGDEFVPDDEIAQGYEAINEAVRRLESDRSRAALEKISAAIESWISESEKTDKDQPVRRKHPVAEVLELLALISAFAKEGLKHDEEKSV